MKLNIKGKHINTELPYFSTSDDVERFNTECREDLLIVFNVK